jgi:hypothetical protein
VQWFKPIILTTWEVENQKTEVSETPSQPVAGPGDQCLSFQLCRQGSTNRTAVQTCEGIKARPYLKNNQHKKGLVEWLKL